MKLLKDNIRLISRLLSLIDLLDNDKWNHRICSINNETIGRHYRHIADFYLQFIDGIYLEFIDYDKRSRDESFEKNISFAKEVLLRISSNFETLKIEDKAIKINMNQSMGVGSIESSIERELMFIYDHAIHHAHIIQIAVSNEFPGLNFKDQFYSHSTIESIECVK